MDSYPGGVVGFIPTGAKTTNTELVRFNDTIQTHLKFGLTETLSSGGVEEITVLAAGPAVAVEQGGQRGAGGAVGLGGAGAGLAGRVARWERRKKKKTNVRVGVSGDKR